MKRFRVFAGPNGSGKSTIINNVKSETIDGRPIDFGVYVNADDIAVMLAMNTFSFSNYKLDNISHEELQTTVLDSGLINDAFSLNDFNQSFVLESNRITLITPNNKERIAQILANFLVTKLLALGEKCTLETVFSHRSKIEIMRYAANEGYKVYLYFVATETPEINIERVRIRVDKGGHNVPYDRITNRYYRSLDLLYEAAQIAYQGYFFDNSTSAHKLIAHFKVFNGIKNWDAVNPAEIPNWFIEYYYNKQK